MIVSYLDQCTELSTKYLDVFWDLVRLLTFTEPTVTDTYRILVQPNEEVVFVSGPFTQSDFYPVNLRTDVVVYQKRRRKPRPTDYFERRDPRGLMSVDKGLVSRDPSDRSAVRSPRTIVCDAHSGLSRISRRFGTDLPYLVPPDRWTRQ